MGVADHCKSTLLELKRKKVHRYVIFKIDEKKKEVVVEKTGGPRESYDDFAAALPENDCRYAVYDFDFVSAENCQKSKIFFIAWSPSISRIRSKMLYATSKDRFRPELDGIHYEIQATDPHRDGSGGAQRPSTLSCSQFPVIDMFDDGWGGLPVYKWVLPIYLNLVSNTTGCMDPYSE